MAKIVTQNKYPVLMARVDEDGNAVYDTSRADNATISTTTYVQNVESVLLAKNEDRMAFTIFNNTDTDYAVRFGTTDDTGITFVLKPGGFYESGTVAYTGEIVGFGTSAGAGTISSTEMVV